MSMLTAAIPTWLGQATTVVLAIYAASAVAISCMGLYALQARIGQRVHVESMLAELGWRRTPALGVLRFAAAMGSVLAGFAAAGVALAIMWERGAEVALNPLTLGGVIFCSIIGAVEMIVPERVIDASGHSVPIHEAAPAYPPHDDSWS
jgi:hypothetical protein